MSELIVYIVILLFVLAHIGMAIRMYLAVHNDKTLSMEEKNSWKLKALVFPAYFWTQYKKTI